MRTSSGSAGAGLAFISYRQSNVLVSEPGFAASAPIRSGRVYTEVGGALNTGLAMANPSGQPAVVSFFLTDDTGTNFGASSLTIAPNSQVAAFLNEAPFASLPSLAVKPVTDARTFSFTSNVPISVVAFRTRTNERSEFMMTVLPVTDLAASSGSAA
jgi:hypothetical protein